MSENLGDAVLELRTDNAALNQGLRTAKAGAQGLESTFTSTASIIQGAFASIGIGVSLKAVLDSTIEQERADRLLENAIRATGMAAGFTADQLKAQAAMLQQTTTFSDDAIERVQTRMMAFRNVHGEVFRSAIDLTLDFATVTGRDAESATRLLGQALNDPVQGMSRLRQAGVEVNQALEDQVAKMVKAGDLTGAQTLLINELSKSYGGAALAARDTLGGAIEALKNQFDNLFLELNGPVTESLKNFVNFVTQNLPLVFSTFAAVFTGVKTAIEGVTTSLFFMSQGISNLVTLQFTAAMTSFSQMPNTLGILKSSVDAAKMAFDQTAASIEKADAATKKMAASAPVAAGAITTETKKTSAAFQTLSQGISSTFSNMASQLVQGTFNFKNFSQQVIASVVALIAKMVALQAVMTFLGIPPGAGAGLGMFLGRARGGPVNQGQPYIVGERGPELFIPANSGHIVPNHRLEAGGGGGLTQVFNVSGMDFSDDNMVGRILTRMGQMAREGAEQALDASISMADAVSMQPLRAV